MFFQQKKINVIFDISRTYNGILYNTSKAGVFYFEVNVLSFIIKKLYNKFNSIYLTAECDKIYFDDVISKELPIYSKCKFINKLELENILNDINAYFSFSFMIPNIINKYNIKNYLVIHDLCPLLHPEYYSSDKNKQIASYNFGQSIYNSISENTTIITISEYSKNNIITHIIKDRDIKVINVSSGINKDKFFKIKSKENNKNKYYFLDKKYLLSISQLRPYKNMIFLVNSFISFLEEYKIEDLYLVLCGEYGEDIAKLVKTIESYQSYKDKIILTGFVSDEDINLIYNKAFCFVFPSLFEGFGLPLLEAMETEIPIISSNITSMPEVYGNAAIGFNPKNQSELVNAIKDIYYNKKLRLKLIKNAKKQKNKFSIKNTSKKIVNTILDN